MKGIYLILSTSLLFCFSSFAQEEDKSYKNGYIISRFDTIKCQILFDKKNPVYWDKFVARLNSADTVCIAAINSVRGFGIKDNEIDIHYGLIATKNISGRKYIFIQKTITGPLELYEHKYVKWQTSQRTGITVSENFTDYYLGSSNNEFFPFPRQIRLFTKKEVENFLYWSSQSFWTINKKKATVNELISMIINYNSTVVW